MYGQIRALKSSDNDFIASGHNQTLILHDIIIYFHKKVWVDVVVIFERLCGLELTRQFQSVALGCYQTLQRPLSTVSSASKGMLQGSGMAISAIGQNLCLWSASTLSFQSGTFRDSASSLIVLILNELL
jgi:hypothetical protein